MKDDGYAEHVLQLDAEIDIRTQRKDTELRYEHGQIGERAGFER